MGVMDFANALRRPLGAVVMVWLIGAVHVGAHAADLKVDFDFARQASYKDVTPTDRAKQFPDERLLSVKLPISVRFAGFASGEIENLDIEVDGSTAGLRVESFCPTTQLVSDAMTIETTTSTKNSKSLGGTLGGAIPVPIGAIVAQITPSLNANATKSNEDTEKIRRLPPKEPIVVSGTFAEGHGVFYKIKPSSQTSLEGVHELEIKFVAPATWKGGSLRVSCVARGHHTVMWVDQPTIFGRAVEAVALYPEGSTVRRETAERPTKTVDSRTTESPARKASFFDEAADGAKRAAKAAFAGVAL
ncbi:MAG TPA: hypothetical protein VGM76_15520 [Lacipirellulaceae bacterium]|jgi:hypothetical protein